MEKKIKQYCLASGLTASNDEPRQVSTLLYCMGEEADDILSSTNISDGEKAKYSFVMGKFDEYFKVRKNVIFKRAQFNRRNQLPDESVEEYTTVLYQLVDSCDYGNFRDEMLRDRLVVGIRDMALSDHLQMDPDLTLAKTTKIVRQKEVVHQHNTQLQGGLDTKFPIDLSPIDR